MLANVSRDSGLTSRDRKGAEVEIPCVLGTSTEIVSASAPSRSRLVPNDRLVV
ncbi:hypothetical protein VT84_00355 [Gemmata sp. SH-PL17]|nr:hypothetical protein VT84_00355 [Gemmata sp. SH-PL17]